MTAMHSEVIGLIEIELPSDELHEWLVDDDSDFKSRLTSFRSRYQNPALGANVVIADVTQLNADLRVELARLLAQLA